MADKAAGYTPGMGSPAAQRLPRGDWRFEGEGDGGRFIIPTRPFWPVALFMLVWLGGWAAGEGSALRSILSEGSPWFAKAFLLFWLAGWTVGGAFAAVVLILTSGLARETLWRDGGDFCVGWGAFGLRWTRRFDIGRMGPVRAARPPRRGLEPGGGAALAVGGAEAALRPSSSESRTGGPWRAGERGAGVEFTVGEKTVSVGEGLDAGQAARLADQLALRFGLRRGEDAEAP